MCTLDHLGKMRSFKQQRHHLFIWPQQYSQPNSKEIYINQAQPYCNKAAAGNIYPFVQRGKATLKNTEPSLKMSDTEVLWASPSPTFTNLLLESET